MGLNETKLEEHLKAHAKRRDLAMEREKQKQAEIEKVRHDIRSELKLRKHIHAEPKLILDTEIWSIPPSVNHYWESNGGVKYICQDGLDFHELVKTIVPPLRTCSRLKLGVIFHFPDNRVRDIDNYLKATLDSLVKCCFCFDDEQFDELSVKRGEIVQGGLIKLNVWEF